MDIGERLLAEISRQTAVLEENNILLRQVISADKLGEKEFYTVAEAAERLRRSPGTIRKWISCRQLQAKKMNGGRKSDRYLIPLAEIVRKTSTTKRKGVSIEITKNHDTLI